MDYLQDIGKIARQFVNDANADKCRFALQQILKYINDEDMNYRIRCQHRQDKGQII
jgi:hypothetical protein